jgi:hypothetical protein
MASIPTELTPQVQLTDPKTGNGTQDLLQKINDLIRALRDHETRLADLE